MIKFKLILSIYFFLFIICKANSEEVQFKSSTMDILDDGNIVLAKDTEVFIPSKNIMIEADNLKYDKNKNILTFTNSVRFHDKIKKLIIESDKIIYEEDKGLIFSEGKSKLNIENKYDIKSKNIYYNNISEKIFGRNTTLIEDDESNIYILKEKFEFNIKNEIIKTRNSTIIDNAGNRYIFNDLIINLKTNEIAGKEINIEFENSYFGNIKNDPTLKGRSAYSNPDELKVYKAVFSTCNIDNKKCRGWELNTNEFNHDKKKKVFEYKDSWLKIFDYRIFFLPYFNHPDPTVKRKSGFLTPSYSTSENLGISLNIPYFKTLSIDKDITLSPRFYADKSFLLQNEYRQALKNSKILSDFSFLVGETGTKGHFFYNQLGKLNENVSYELNLQDVKGDNYLKNYKLINTSSLIKDDNLLVSNLDINWDFTDSKLNTSFKIFKDLSRNYHDRYQYIFPEFNFTKNIELAKNYDGNFSFNSYGFNKNYDTNVFETTITNDFLYSSNELISSKGIVSKYDLLLKNSNSYANNSSNFEENTAYNLFGTMKIDTSLPMQKQSQEFRNYLKPIISYRYSPNGNNDISSKDVELNYENVFSLNRIGNSHQVEGGQSISAGVEFKKSYLDGKDIFDFKVANVIKDKENHKLPSKSKLNEKRSDIFGNLNFYIDDNLEIGYYFSNDKDLKYNNSQQLDLIYSVNNFITNFSYHDEKNDLKEKENLKINTNLLFDEENKISFNLSKDLKDDFTQYYNLIYEYKTDCISFNFNYNKSFYRDGNIEPDTSLTFLMKIIPFTEVGVPNFSNIIGN